ncbi:MAG: hypothetical protein RBG13Loki_0959 [Promethearchaeota archaeon CR_4]|nr:MAG: hypothetical protein RBG13Loki_0959 [Candidatus Lokiarchaeota archaeon CR_4]
MEIRYSQYKTGQSYIQIPMKAAKMLGWKDQDILIGEIKPVDGKVGIFLTKKENKE